MKDFYNERKVQPFFSSDILTAFKDAIISAEELSTHIELFSGVEELNKLEVKKNQIIYGRRGTGKSHFLNANWPI